LNFNLFHIYSKQTFLIKGYIMTPFAVKLLITQQPYNVVTCNCFITNRWRFIFELFQYGVFYVEMRSGSSDLSCLCDFDIVMQLIPKRNMYWNIEISPISWIDSCSIFLYCLKLNSHSWFLPSEWISTMNECQQISFYILCSNACSLY